MAFLSSLLPSSGLIAWYPLDQLEDNSVEIADADRVVEVLDESGNDRHLDQTAASPDAPSWKLDQLNGRKGILHNEESPLLYSPSPPNVGHVFAVLQVTGAAFDNTDSTFAGFLSGETSGNNAIFVGTDSDTKWVDFGLAGAYQYRKSHTDFADADQQAPFDNFELIEAEISSGGLPLNGIQVGYDRAFTSPDRTFEGTWLDILLYDSILSGSDLERVYMFYDLKFGLWEINGTTLKFPDPSITQIPWSRYKKLPKNWDRITSSHTYEDEGRSFNQVGSDVTQTWEIGFTGLTKSELEIFDAFNDQAKRKNTFSFTDREGVTHTNCRLSDYSSGHFGHRSWVNSADLEVSQYIGG